VEHNGVIGFKQFCTTFPHILKMPHKTDMPIETNPNSAKGRDLSNCNNRRRAKIVCVPGTSTGQALHQTGTNQELQTGFKKGGTVMKTNYRNEATVQHKIRQLNILTIRVTNILVADFNLHHLHLAPPLGATVVEFR